MFKKIFIVGVGRSGTSLLQSMLNAHSEVAFIPETHFLRKYVFKEDKTLDEKNILTFKKELSTDEEFRRANIAADEILEIGNTYSEVYGQLLKKYLQKKDKSIIGDKDPRNIDFIPHLKRFFPESKIIHIIRDPRDVVLSRTKADWSKHWPFNLHAYLYNTQLQRGRAQGQLFFGANYREIYYEDLIENPKEELSRICEFIDVKYEEKMLDFGYSAKELVDKKEMQWKKETFGPLLTSNKNKWKSAFTPYQIDLIQKVCSSVFRDGKYVKEEVKSSIINNFHTAGAGIFKMLYPLRIKVLKNK